MDKPRKYKRKAYEKIWNVLQEIEELRMISPEGGDIFFPLRPSNYRGVRNYDVDHETSRREAILKKLAQEKSIEIIRQPIKYGSMWTIKLASNYEPVFTKYEELYSDEAENYELAKAARESKPRESLSIKYDPNDRVLYLGKDSVKFQKGDTNQSELCRVLFKDQKSIKKAWDTDEMLLEWGWAENRVYDEEGRLQKENRLKVYTAASDVNDKVLKATKGAIPYLLTYTTKSVSLTEEYRKLVS